MPNLADLSDFLKKTDVKSGDIVVFVNEGDIRKVDFSKAKDGSDEKKVFQITIKLPDGREKIATLNKTSQNALSSKYGINTENWKDKKAQITFIEQLSFGKLTEILVFKPVE